MSESARTPAQIAAFDRVLARQRARRQAQQRPDNHARIGRHEYAEIRAMLNDAAGGERQWA